MRETNLKTLDLNLLVALKALLEEKHVTRAATRVNLSQPAMSRALLRLREMFQDPLLVKGTKGMALTVRASELYQPLQNILRDITDMVSLPSVDPATMKGEITIATRDYELATVFPKIIHQVTTMAPNIKLSIVPLIGDDLNPLEQHNVDFVLSGTPSKSATLHRYTLYEESFACLISKSNSLVKKEITLKNYLEMKHCLVTISNVGVAVVDKFLAQKNLSRDITVRIPSFLAVSHIISHSDLIVTLPRRLGELLAEQKNIVLLNPPLKIPRFPIYLYWHIRNQHHPVHTWLRRLIRSAV